MFQSQQLYIQRSVLQTICLSFGFLLCIIMIVVNFLNNKKCNLGKYFALLEIQSIIKIMKVFTLSFPGGSGQVAHVLFR